jgi:hypothetical protein
MIHVLIQCSFVFYDFALDHRHGKSLSYNVKSFSMVFVFMKTIKILF